MKPFDAIVRVVRQRIEERTPFVMQLLEVKRRYNGDWVVPLPSLENEPTLDPMTPFLVANAIDNLGRRGASVMPWWHFPEKRRGDPFERRARTRRRAWAATLFESQFQLTHQRAMRHLAGYSSCVLRVVCDWKTQMPRIVCEDPLSTFPAPRKPEDGRPPEDCAFIYEMSAGMIRSMWPKARTEMGGPIAPRPDGYTEMWTLVEWVDADEVVMGIVGPKFPMTQYKSYDPRMANVPWLELSRAPNLAGQCPVVVPNKIGLAEIACQIANAVGMTDMMAKIMALAVSAEEKATYPDMYAIGTPNGVPTLVGGAWKDGRTGEMNLLQDVSAVGTLRTDISTMTLQLASMLERNFNASNGSNPAFQGETYGALRTGRAIDSIVGAQVDPMIQEMHQIVESYLPFLVDMTFATYEGAWPDKKYELFSGWKNDVGVVSFTPSVELAESHRMVAQYAVAGADRQAMTIELGQLRATKAISQKTFREQHPDVGDAESEEFQTLIEDMDQALMASILQGLAAPAGTPGALDPYVGSLIREFIDSGLPVFKAYQRAHEEAQKLQASQPAPVPPGMAGAPANMPGLGGPAQPGLGIVPPPDQTNLGPNPDQTNLHGLVRALGTAVPSQAAGR
jgi:hypothetical protein